jgi:hypothetical protein
LRATSLPISRPIVGSFLPLRFKKINTTPYPSIGAASWIKIDPPPFLAEVLIKGKAKAFVIGVGK